MKSVQTIRPNDYELNRVKEDLQLSLNPIIQNPLVDGVFLENLQFTANTLKRVEHKLGRPFKFYIIARMQPGAAGIGAGVGVHVYENGSQDYPSKYINLYANYDCTITLYVG